MDLIILAIITAYIFFRLSKNLGKIDEEEKQEIHKKLLERKKQIEEILERAQKSVNPASSPTKSEKIIVTIEKFDFWGKRRDSNPRPSEPQPDALTN